MRALICDGYDGLDGLRIGEMPDPEPAPGVVLINVTAATVNFADTLIVAGLYQLRPEPPFIPGTEVAGVVADSGGVDGISVGDRVCGYTLVGGMAERVLVRGNSLIKTPDNVSDAEAAAIPVAYGTSYHALVDRGRLQAEEVLLVLGAAGGVGLAAVQIGRALGATVIGAVSSSEKAEAVLASGAHRVIRYDEVDLREGIGDATGGKGVDVVYDPVGGDSTEAALRSTNWGGRLLVVGFAAGDIPRIPLNLPLVKGNELVGVFWGRFTEEEPDRNIENFAHILEWVDDGTLRPMVQKTYPLSGAVSAMRWVADRKAVGRVVVEP